MSYMEQLRLDLVWVVKLSRLMEGKERSPQGKLFWDELSFKLGACLVRSQLE